MPDGQNRSKYVFPEKTAQAGVILVNPGKRKVLENQYSCGFQHYLCKIIIFTSDNMNYVKSTELHTRKILLQNLCFYVIILLESCKEGGEKMGRENFVVNDSISKLFAELASARKMNKTELFAALVQDEAERRAELLTVFRQQQELERKAAALRK